MARNISILGTNMATAYVRRYKTEFRHIFFSTLFFIPRTLTPPKKTNPAESPVNASSASDVIQIYFTSGTTGEPKMVPHTQGSYGYCHWVTGKYWLDLTPSDLHWNMSDTGWAKSAWSNVFAPWSQGAAVFVHGEHFFKTFYFSRAKTSSVNADTTEKKIGIKMLFALIVCLFPTLLQEPLAKSTTRTRSFWPRPRKRQNWPRPLRKVGSLAAAESDFRPTKCSKQKPSLLLNLSFFSLCASLSLTSH